MGHGCEGNINARQELAKSATWLSHSEPDGPSQVPLRLACSTRHSWPHSWKSRASACSSPTTSRRSPTSCRRCCATRASTWRWRPPVARHSIPCPRSVPTDPKMPATHPTRSHPTPPRSPPWTLVREAIGEMPSLRVPSGGWIESAPRASTRPGDSWLWRFDPDRQRVVDRHEHNWQPIVRRPTVRRAG